MKETREYFRSMVSQRGIKQTFFQGEKEYNASWDYNVSPEGKHYFSVCAEGPRIDAMLYEYIPGSCEMRKCVDTKTDIIMHPRTIRASKIHTCMDFMEDGRVIMNNHTTAAAPSHPDWMPEAYYGHPWEGFPGSNVFIYDPKTGKTEDLGIPVPYESIYGASYDPTHRAYYFSGYFRGHGYRLDLDTRKVTDYGQFTEFGVYLHHKGPDGNVYLSTRSGSLLRYNVQNQMAERLGPKIPEDPNLFGSREHNVMAYAANGPDGKIYFCAHHSEQLYAYDIEKNELSVLGSPVPAWYREKYKGLYLIFGMDFDKYGVLWYGLKVLGNCMRFVSWDLFRGGEPVDHGIVGTPAHASWNFCQAKIVGDVFYGSTTNHATDGPAVVELDLQVMREDVDKPRELGWDPIIYRGTADVDLYPGEEKLTGRAAVDATGPAPGTEDVPPKRTVHGGSMFIDGILRDKPVNNQHELNIEKKYVTKLWQHLGEDKSPVLAVTHDSEGNVIAISGTPDGGYYRSVIRDGKLLASEKTEYTPADGVQIADKYKQTVLPVPAGRAWLMDATCEAPLADGSMLVGNRAGGLAIVHGEQTFLLGQVILTGAIHALSASPDRRTVFGVAGDRDDRGVVFSYSMDFGIVQHGTLQFVDSNGELGSSSEPYCIDFAPDGMSIAIGVRDRLGCVYEIYPNQPDEA